MIKSSLLSLLIVSLGFSISFAKGWKTLRKERGIVISQREEPGRDLPSFKGVGLVEASMYECLAVLRDGKRRKQWMTKSGKTMILKRKSVFEAVSYQQTLAPFPVSDRDVVMHTQVYLRKQPQEMIATFNGISWTDKVPGVNRDDYVLMPYLRGYWRLIPKGDNQTEVTYMVNTDPGGLLPKFLIKRITKDVPFWTLVGMRKQIKKTKGLYDSFLNDYDPKRSNGKPKDVPPEPPQGVIKYLN